MKTLIIIIYFLYPHYNTLVEYQSVNCDSLYSKINSYKNYELVIPSETVPEFKGGNKSIQQFLKKKIRETYNYNGKERVVLVLIVDSYKKVQCPKLLKKSNDEKLNEMIIEIAINLIFKEPAYISGKPVDYSFLINIQF